MRKLVSNRSGIEFVAVFPGYIPAPMLFGAVIDSTCRLWETDTDGSSFQCHRGSGTGSCLLFDTDQLRWRTYGLALIVQLLQLTFAILLYFAIRHRHFDNGDELPDKTMAAVTDGDTKSPATVEELTLLEVKAADGHADGAAR